MLCKKSVHGEGKGGESFMLLIFARYLDVSTLLTDNYLQWLCTELRG